MNAMLMSTASGAGAGAGDGSVSSFGAAVEEGRGEDDEEGEDFWGEVPEFRKAASCSSRVVVAAWFFSVGDSAASCCAGSCSEFSWFCWRGRDPEGGRDGDEEGWGMGIGLKLRRRMLPSNAHWRR